MRTSKVKAILLGMLVFLVVVGSWFFYRQITRTDYLLPGDVLVPKGHDLSGLFFIEQPDKDLESYKIQNVSKYIPVLYQESIPNLKPEVIIYLKKRNEYIQGFEKKFRSPSNNIAGKPFMEPFTEMESIDEILPVKFQDFDGMIVITKKDRWIKESKIFLLDSNFQVLDGPEEVHAYFGGALVSANFLDRAWVQTFTYGATNGSLFFSTINVINHEMSVKTKYHGNDQWEKNPFDQLKIFNTTTNPTMALFKKRPIEWSSNPFFVFYFFFSIFFYAFRPFLSVILPFLLIFLLILFRKQILQFIRSVRKKFVRKENQ